MDNKTSSKHEGGKDLGGIIDRRSMYVLDCLEALLINSRGVCISLSIDEGY